MRKHWLSATQKLKTKGQITWNEFRDKIQAHWFQALVLSLIALLLWHKDLSFQLDLNTAARPIAMASPLPLAKEAKASTASLSMDFLKDLIPVKTVETVTVKNLSQPLAEKNNLANTYSNMLYDKKQKAASTMTHKQQLKRKKQEDYVRRFVKVAQAEMRKYGIPASIKLAQGLIESNAGDSRLSRKNNNHFGMKCFSRKCKKGHCSNFTDDSHKDFFRIYPSAWESYRAHSHLLRNKRYRHLTQQGNNYKAWAHGLKKAGYATDKRYAQKLIQLIESLNLDQWDI